MFGDDMGGDSNQTANRKRYKFKRKTFKWHGQPNLPLIC